MKTKFVPLLLLGLALLACILPAGIATQIPPAAESTTVTPPPPPAPTHTPTPPLPPTPIPGARIESADLAIFNGDWDTALREYQIAFETDPDPEIQSAALLGIGRTRFHRGIIPRPSTPSGRPSRSTRNRPTPPRPTSPSPRLTKASCATARPPKHIRPTST
ncbi:MAG: tetratricopeptide repeat protein [Chloroflexi bacterium]|nr:tetratricopeptide repeat protein [Chloroflexota bacterium]